MTARSEPAAQFEVSLTDGTRAWPCQPAIDAGGVTVRIEGDTPASFVQAILATDLADDDAYVLFPACAYAGNRFQVLAKDYPPMFTPAQAALDLPVTITDVPRLNPDGSGIISVTTGDVSIPAVGIFHPVRQRALLLFTVQEIDGVNLGLAYQRGGIRVTYPARREQTYRWPHLHPGADVGRDFAAGEQVRIPYRLIEADCASLAAFYRLFFEQRKCLGLDDTLPVTPSPERLFEIHRDRINHLTWSYQGRFYGSADIGEHPGVAWQPGWVGGAQSTYPLMKLGGELEWERSCTTLDFLFGTQTESGLFADVADAAGKIVSASFFPDGAQRWVSTRKSADVLYFLFKHFELFAERGRAIPPSWLDGTRRLADGFARLWQRHGQFGQFVDGLTGELVVGGSTAAAMAAGGLARAAGWFDRPDYLVIAKAAAELYYRRDALAGYTTGGPEEILQCPDSESCFALLESLVCLFEVTGEAEWLERAKHVAHLGSSWVVAYNYRFPPESEFGRLGMRTVGSVFANVQNKHAAPGICTLSGDSLYKLYRWTGDDRYLELCREIVLTIGQYVSTDERPIYSWDVPKDASLLADDTIRAPRQRLPQGFICERVNLSDWEGQRCVGGVFNGSTWAEVANLLAIAEAIPLLASPGATEPAAARGVRGQRVDGQRLVR